MRGLLWLLAAGAGLAALVLGIVFIQAAQIPYDEQGRYFEDGVVFHQQAVAVYGLLALLCAATAVGLVWLAHRSSGRDSPANL